MKDLKEIKSLLLELKEYQIRENFAERVKELEHKFELVRGYQDEQEKKFRALEKYLGIEFRRELFYEKLNNQKSLL